jgi:hypothetical protein
MLRCVLRCAALCAVPCCVLCAVQYYLGVAQQLQVLGILQDSTQLAGASAGSLIVACIKSGLPFDTIQAACFELARWVTQPAVLSKVVVTRIAGRVLGQAVEGMARSKGHGAWGCMTSPKHCQNCQHFLLDRLLASAACSLRSSCSSVLDHAFGPTWPAPSRLRDLVTRTSHPFRLLLLTGFSLVLLLSFQGLP